MCKTKWYHIMVGMHVRGKSIKKFRGMINIPFGKEFLGGGGIPWMVGGSLVILVRFYFLT